MADPTGSLRLFFALWPERGARADLDHLARDVQRMHGGRRVRPEMLHLTLAFVGSVPAARVAALGEIGAALPLPALSLVLDRLGGLSRRGLIWVAPSEPPAALMAHAEALAHALREAGFDLERRVFRPHVTLLRRGTWVPEPATECEPLVMRARRRALVVSEQGPKGPRYRELRYWDGGEPGIEPDQ